MQAFVRGLCCLIEKTEDRRKNEEDLSEMREGIRVYPFERLLVCNDPTD